MELQTVDQLEFSSIFGTNSNASVKPELRNSGFEGSGSEGSIFVPDKVEDQDIPGELTEEEKAKLLENPESIEDKSIFEDKNKVDPKDFNSVKSIFEELIKNNQLLPLEDEKLETPEDIQALINANVIHQVEEFKSNENNSWYASKSPAWRIVAEFSEKVQHPSELLPFIQSVQTIEVVSDLNAKEEEDAEKIVRMALVSRNESQDIIDETISTYKDNGKLSILAEKYQPALIQQEKNKMESLSKQKEQDEIDNYQMIKQIHEDAIKVLETPFMGKHKMKKEEKAAIYNLIAAPDENSGGYRIFSEIDNLYETKNFEKLRMIGLLLTDDVAYNTYIGMNAVGASAERMMRKVKTTSTGNTTSEIVDPSSMRTNNLQRPSNKESGFGYFTK
jgi:hypothetical protein